MAGGSYGGFIAMEYAIAYPDRVRAMILRDTSADRSNLDRAYENARNQSRVEINWDNFDRYWGGRIRDDEDLKARWAEIIPLYDFEYDPVQVGRARARPASTGTRRTTGASPATCPATTSSRSCPGYAARPW